MAKRRPKVHSSYNFETVTVGSAGPRLIGEWGTPRRVMTAEGLMMGSDDGFEIKGGAAWGSHGVLCGCAGRLLVTWRDGKRDEIRIDFPIVFLFARPRRWEWRTGGGKKGHRRTKMLFSATFLY